MSHSTSLIIFNPNKADKTWKRYAQLDKQELKNIFFSIESEFNPIYNELNNEKLIPFYKNLLQQLDEKGYRRYPEKFEGDDNTPSFYFEPTRFDYHSKYSYCKHDLLHFIEQGTVINNEGKVVLISPQIRERIKEFYQGFLKEVQTKKSEFINQKSKEVFVPHVNDLISEDIENGIFYEYGFESSEWTNVFDFYLLPNFETGHSVQDTIEQIQSLLNSLTSEKLTHIIAEFNKMLFGNDTTEINYVKDGLIEYFKALKKIQEILIENPHMYLLLYHEPVSPQYIHKVLKKRAQEHKKIFTS